MEVVFTIHTILDKLDEFHLRKMAESRADDAESRNGRRLPHNSGLKDEIRFPKQVSRIHLERRML